MAPAEPRSYAEGLLTGVVRRGLWATGGMATAAALVLVAVVFFVAVAVTDNLLVTPPGGDAAEEVGLGVVLTTTVVGGLVGSALAWAMSRFVRRPRNTFLVVCVAGLGLYGTVPFTAAEEAATGVWLNLMHLSVALPVAGGLAAYLPETRARGVGVALAAGDGVQ